MAADDRAVVVGITRYPELGDLGGPENDALEFKDWLTDPDGGDLPEENVILILSSDYPLSLSGIDAEPTISAVDREFDRLHVLGNQNEGKAGRRLYMFMAGHGYGPNVNSAALLMANAARGRTGYHIAGSLWADWFRQSAFFEEVVLFMDCCRENYPRAPIRTPPWESKNAGQPARHFYGLATDFTDSARERVTNGEMRGAFTRAVVNGLRNAHNDTGSITGASLEAFVYSTINAEVPLGEEHQEPVFFYDKMKDITLATRPTATRCYHLRVIVEGDADGLAVEVRSGDLEVVPRLGTGPNRGEWELLTRGIYKIVLGDGREKYVEVTGEQEQIDVVF